METRTTHSSVTFTRPFQMASMDGIAPAGTYRMDVEEEKLEVLSGEKWRQTAVVLQVARAGITEYLPVDPEELRDALARDGEAVAQITSPLTERGQRLRGVLRLRPQGR